MDARTGIYCCCSTAVYMLCSPVLQTDKKPWICCIKPHIKRPHCALLGRGKRICEALEPLACNRSNALTGAATISQLQRH